MKKVFLTLLLITLSIYEVNAQRRGLGGLISRISGQVSSPVPPPSGQLVYLTNLNNGYAGAFRTITSCGEDMQFSGGSLAWNAAGNSGAGSFYIATHSGNVAEISAPAVVNTATLGSMNTATCLQSATEASETRKVDGNTNCSACDGSGHAQPSGLLVHNSLLWVNNTIFYDGVGGQPFYLYNRPVNLSTTGSVKGLFGVISSAANFKRPMGSKAVSEVTSDWVSLLGGDLILGKSSGSVISNWSFGPAAFLLDSTTLSALNTYHATTITSVASDKSFNDSGAAFPAFVNGDKILIIDQDRGDAPNNTTIYTVNTRTASKVTVVEAVQDWGTGDHMVIGKVNNSTALLYGDSARGPTGACGTSNGDNVGNGTVQCNDGFLGSIGGTRFSTYKYWSQADLDEYGFIIKNTNTFVSLTVHGARDATYGGFGYGCGCGVSVAVPGQLTCNGGDSGTCGATGEGYFYDPEHSTDKGDHGFPYYYFARFYDVRDFQAVIAGSKDARDILPYDYGIITGFRIMPNTATGEQTHFGAAYDSTNQVIWIAQNSGPDSAYPLFNKFALSGF